MVHVLGAAAGAATKFGVKAAAAFLASTSILMACDASEMATTEDGFLMKVVAGSNQINVFADEAGGDTVFTMDLMRPYLVICETSDFYRVTDADALSVDEALAGNTGFVLRDQVIEWRTREALRFSDVAFLEGRPEIVAWDSETELLSFMDTRNMRAHPPAFREDLEATLMRERSTRPYPVLGSGRGVVGSADRRYFNVLVPAALPPGAAAMTIDPGAGSAEEVVSLIEDTLTSATILVVFDATGSMDEFALAVANALGSALTSLPQNVRDGTRVGFVFYKDAEDAERLVSFDPLPIEEASNLLREAASLMSGGGDTPEPVLDAVYQAANLYEWGQSAGRRIMIAVLNGDAKPETEGLLDDAGRVPAGLDVFDVTRDLVDQSIPTITVQAGPSAGPNLEFVLETMATETGGEFIAWGSGLDSRSIAGSMTSLMVASSTEAIEAGEATMEQLVFDMNGFPTVLLDVVNAEQLERLRLAGVDFNITRNDGGVLVQEAYMLENSDLLQPVFEIEKDTLLRLINLYSVLATTSADGDALREAVAEAIAAIAGEDFNPEGTIQEIIERRLGIEFQSELLSFEIAYLESLVPEERLGLQRRIQDAADSLSNFLDANLEEFDTLPAVWMPIAALP